jgi:hypothetical protein
LQFNPMRFQEIATVSTYLHLFSLTSDHVGPLDILIEILNNPRITRRPGTDFCTFPHPIPFVWTYLNDPSISEVITRHVASFLNQPFHDPYSPILPSMLCIRVSSPGHNHRTYRPNAGAYFYQHRLTPGVEAEEANRKEPIGRMESGTALSGCRCPDLPNVVNQSSAPSDLRCRKAPISPEKELYTEAARNKV